MRFRRVNKMPEKSAEAREIRKYRKKLRQIEILEAADRELTDEEIFKVCKKCEIRNHLLELLANSSVTDEDLLTSDSNESVVRDTDHSEQTVGDGGRSTECSSADVTDDTMKRTLECGDTLSCSGGDVGSSQDRAVEAKRLHTCPPDSDSTGKDEENVHKTENPTSQLSLAAEGHHAEPEETTEKLQSESSRKSKPEFSVNSGSTKSESKQKPVPQSETPTKTKSKPSQNSDSTVASGKTESDSKQKSVLQSETLTKTQSEPSQNPEESQSKSRKKSRKSPKTSQKAAKSEPNPKTCRPERRHFTAQTLAGHNDVVCSVAVSDQFILTGSRDTTLRLWDRGLGQEVCSMGGHTDTVSAVLLLTGVDAHTVGRCLDEAVECVGVSGSRDCSLRYWNLLTGVCLHSCYTYNTITALGFLSCSQHAYIMVGTEGGKLEMWDVLANCVHASVAANQDPITAVKVVGSMVYAASAGGLISVYQLSPQDSLHIMFQSENLKLASGAPVHPRPISCLAPHGDLIYYGDEGMNLKVLDWKLGLVHKLSHHSGDFGFTDAVCCVGDRLLLASGYDLDNGVGYINGTCVVQAGICQGRSTRSHCDESQGRILCMAAHLSSLDQLTIVTGGTELKLWTEGKHQIARTSLVDTQFVPQFDRVARNSDVDTDSDTDHDESEDDPPLPWHHDDVDDERRSGWTSWCILL